MISVLILALNEEVNLPKCLEAVSWSDDVVVLDSGSTDNTVEIAKSAAARVVFRPWDNERAQRVASLRLGFKYRWVFNPDADEVASEELSEEMRRIASNPARPEVAYWVRRNNYFEGRLLKHSGFADWWVMRFFRPERITFRREVNLQYLADGPVGYLQGRLDHYSFAKGLNPWREKHRLYAAQEAREALAARSRPLALWELASGDPTRRRRALKDLSFRLPSRPLMRFLYMYVARRGFLDGGPGLRYCRLMAWYEELIDLEIRRLQAGSAGNAART